MTVKYNAYDLVERILPIEKANVISTSLPIAESNILSTDISPTNSPSYIRIYICVSVAGVFRIARTIGNSTITENMNSGNNLTPDAAYIFTSEWRSNDTLNFRYSVTSGTITILRVDEIGGAE